MRQHRWFFLLLMAALLLPGCQATDEVPTEPEQAVQQVKVNPLTVSISTQFATSSAPEENECLNCHSDKQRLIDTAKVEQVAESESSGVG